jgi:hypothetical protein
LADAARLDLKIHWARRVVMLEVGTRQWAKPALWEKMRR